MKRVTPPVPARERKLIVIVIMSGNILLDIAGPVDVFVTAGKILTAQAATDNYDVVLASPGRATQIICSAGIQLNCTTSVLDIQSPIDTLLVAGYNNEAEVSHYYQDFYAWLSITSKHIRRIGAVCVGAFALAKAGLLNGKQATTHWEYCEQLQNSFPEVQVNPNPFFIKDENIYTSGGVSSGMDLALALIEEDQGKSIAAQVARKLVLYLKRPGSQASFSALLPGYALHNTLAGQLRTWIVKHAHTSIGVMELAAQVNMSTRHFSRLFTEETGVSPAKFVEKLRVEIARKYLEDSSLSIDAIAEKCGFGGSVSMRRIFLRQLLLSPSDYRKTFRTALEKDHR